MRLSRLSMGLLGAGLALAAAAPARAALGGDASSVEADRVSMKGEVRSSSVSGFEVREITTAAGTRVREYLSPGGKVFALAWQGPVLPDLRQMLGAYYARYAQAVSGPHPRGGHRHLSIEQPGLVVQVSGRMRAFSGRAWDPGLLPPNFSVNDIT
ncbi:MAG: DUF2844 domain-containing protein [Steroidobacteraceae bacterium]